MIKDFYTNVAMREAVKGYFLTAIEQEAIKRIFDREDTSHIADAKDLIFDIFNHMDADFAAKKEISTENQAR